MVVVSFVTHAPIIYPTADVDYLAVNHPFNFDINDPNHVNRTCVDITLLHDIIVQEEYYELFLVRLNSTSTPLITPQVVIVVMNEG